jgi:hypothetical protein
MMLWKYDTMSPFELEMEWEAKLELASCFLGGFTVIILVRLTSSSEGIP